MKISKKKNIITTPKEHKIQLFLDLVKEGKEQKFLIEMSGNENKNTEPSFLDYKKAMMQTYNKQEILELLTKDPIKFFQKGWFFPSKQWSPIFILWATMEKGSGYAFHNCLPDEFWEDAFMVKTLLNAANEYKKYYLPYEVDPSTNLLPDTYQKYMCRGLKFGIINSQLQAIDKLQENIILLHLKLENNVNNLSKFEIEQSKIQEEYLTHKLELLKKNPLFMTDDKQAQEIYDKTCECAKNRVTKPLKQHCGREYDY